MSLEKFTKNIIDTDVLVIGGGTAGAPLAAKAAESGLRVTIAEKANVQRSGNVGHGIDGYGIFPRDIPLKKFLEM